jgi:hypothetical protein
VIFDLAAGDFLSADAQRSAFHDDSGYLPDMASGRKRLSQLPYNERTAIDNG